MTKNLLPETWMHIAMKEIGTREILGPGDNPRILEYQKCTRNVSHDEVSWCSSFANWVMWQGQYHGTGSALARSWLEWGMELETGKFGCLVVLSRGSDPKFGHVGFYWKRVGGFIKLLSGNSNNQVRLSWYDSKNILGFRWPTVVDKRVQVLP